jgi:Holliday junction DNA helicase RuvA
MISYIEGKIIELNPAFVVLDCNGIGYMLNISINTFNKLEGLDSCKLKTHLSIKEDSHTLFGFFDDFERKIFRLLISVSGVGPSTARVILSSMNTSIIRNAIINEDSLKIKSIKGIGLKTAQRIILDLKDKIIKLDEKTELNLNIDNRNREEALSALEVLGFSSKNVHNLIDSLLDKNPSIKLEDLVKEALKQL